jgi:hypothetical protein
MSQGHGIVQLIGKRCDIRMNPKPIREKNNPTGEENISLLA